MSMTFDSTNGAVTESSEFYSGTDSSSSDSSRFVLADQDFNIANFLTTTEPKANNLFCVGHFYEKSGSDGEALVNELPSASSRIRSIQLPSYSLDFKFDQTTRKPLIDNFSYDNTVKVDFFEDVKNTVWKYHKNWVSSWWDKDLDVLRVGADGKTRRFDLVTFHYNADGEAEPILYIMCRGLVPTTLNGLKVDVNNGGEDELFSASYKSSKVLVYYNNSLISSNSIYNEDRDIAAMQVPGLSSEAS